jgi:hypothetical protein
MRIYKRQSDLESDLFLASMRSSLKYISNPANKPPPHTRADVAYAYDNQSRVADPVGMGIRHVGARARTANQALKHGQGEIKHEKQHFYL